MMDSSPGENRTLPSLPSLPPLPSTAGVKRPAPSLLPAFEPLSSSPPFSRSAKRQACISPPNGEGKYQKYPTPIPTSTTGILSSSPLQNNLPRPVLRRTQSSVSERAPLSTVATITLPANGDEFLMGRSSNSCHYRLSTNHLISRVHIKAKYVAGTSPLESDKVVIVCCGWNGAKVHSNGQTWELAKGDTFTSETESAEIMLDVQDARVFIAWPFHDRTSSVSTLDSAWDDENSPKARVSALNSRGHPIQSSPLQMGQMSHRLVSPESPTPASRFTRVDLTTRFSDTNERAPVKVYEDESSEYPPDKSTETADLQVLTQLDSQPYIPDGSQSSELSEPEDYKDPNEENDPIIHSFGPFGANISSRLASFAAGGSPAVPRGYTSREPSASPAKSPGSESTNDADPGPVVNHVVNQLAFSRLSSTPLSVIMSHLPANLKGTSPTQIENQGLTKEDLRKVLSAVTCIGEINREGKDAAGKPLESEYYYIPDEDRDEQRRAAVVDGLRKPSLRNCRKQHKQYYWKRPRTP